LPSGVEKSGYQARTVGIVSLLSGVYHLSHQAVKNVMWDLCGVEIGTGSINRLRKEASQSVSPAVESAQNYIQAQPIVGADETGFKQGNADGQNGKNLKAWLWVAVTPLVSFFCVLLSRSAQAANCWGIALLAFSIVTVMVLITGCPWDRSSSVGRI
jgi:transposase